MTALPPEPPVGSIVVDDYGDAFQRWGSGWYQADYHDEPISWREVVNLGPVTVLREGPAK